jgi:hypothetical protein
VIEKLRVRYNTLLPHSPLGHGPQAACSTLVPPDPIVQSMRMQLARSRSENS